VVLQGSGAKLRFHPNIRVIDLWSRSTSLWESRQG
jgi:hypothetical protein